jgi:uncharacterized protein (TIGR03083 family)
MTPLGPVYVNDLFEGERSLLLATLESLSREQWDTPTVCAGWSVKDIAAHLLADDLGPVSRRRDGHTASWFSGEWDDLLRFINRQNEEWVAAMRRVSGPLIVELLRFSGERVFAVYRSLARDSVGPVVDWAGPRPAPMWLHVAREYTERWLHGQQIYDALGVERAKDRRLFAPVLGTFVRALPHTYRDVDAPPGTHVLMEITGDAGGRWSLVRGDGSNHRGTEAHRSAWALHESVDSAPAATVTLDQETAWRLFTKGIDPATARDRATIAGDVGLGEFALRMVSILA